MHKKILVLLTGAIALSISAVPVLASDPPTDDGQYIWQDENGDYWYRNGSEDEYIGEGNYAPDPDSGELMEGNDAGWTEQDGYFELIIIMRTAVCGWKMPPEPHILAPEINIILMTTAIFRNIPILKLIPPPEILQKNPPIPVETPPRRIPILHTQIPLPIQTRKIPPNRKSAASFICGLDSLPMIRSENPCPKKKVISSSVP